MEDKQRAEELWQSLQKVPVVKQDHIMEDWNSFTIGTSIYDIWVWFEEMFNLSVAIDLMHMEDGF